MEGFNIFENDVWFYQKNGIKSIKSDCVFRGMKSEKEIKNVFFKYMHVYKAMATLQDYFDLNRRYQSYGNIYF